MTHLVSSTPMFAGAHAVKRYAGAGIRGADIPTQGDNGGSPALNDDINPASEYRWALVTPTTDGTLTLYPDMTVLFDAPATPGLYSAIYRLWEDCIDRGTATMSFMVGVVVEAVAAVGAAGSIGSALPAVSIPMAGSSVAVSGGAGTLAARISISAAGLAQAAATAGIGANVLLAGAAAATASGNAALAARLNALATGSDVASGTASIAGGPPGAVSAAGNDVASGSAALKVSVNLSGAGVDLVTGGGVLNTSVAVSAAGFAQAMAAGSLALVLPLSAFGNVVSMGAAAASMSFGNAPRPEPAGFYFSIDRLVSFSLTADGVSHGG